MRVPGFVSALDFDLVCTICVICERFRVMICKMIVIYYIHGSTR